MTFQTILSLIVFLLILVGFAVDILPMAATAMIGMMALVLTGCLDAATAMSGFSSPTVLMLAPMFLIAAAFGKTQTINKLSHFVVKMSRGSDKAVVTGYVLLALILVQLINSASAVFFIVYPLVLACCKEMRISPSRIIFPVGLTCMATAGFLPTTSAISMCEVWQGYFTAYEITQYSYSVMDYCLSRIPIVIIVVVFAIFYAPKHLPECVKAEDIGAVETQQTPAVLLTPAQEIVTVLVFFGLIIGVTCSGWIGIPSWEISMTGALILVVAGVMRGGEVYRSLGLSVILLYVGGTAIASALQQSGAVDIIGSALMRLFGERPNGYVFGMVFFLISFVLTQVLSNSAVNYIFVPICLIACKALGCNPVGALFCSLCGASTGYLTPMANPTAPIMFEVGGYKIKDILKVAPQFAIPAAIASVGWIMTLFPLY